QYGNQEAAHQGHHGDGWGTIDGGQQKRFGHDDGEEDKGAALIDEVVVAEGAVDGEVENGDAAAGEDLPEVAPPLAITVMAEPDEDERGGDTKHDAAEFADPPVLEGVLEEVHGGAEDQQHGDPSQPLAADDLFQVLLGLCDLGRRRRSSGAHDG